MDKQCAFIREDGTRCKAHSMTGCEHCFAHNESCAEIRKEAVTKGGLQLKRPQLGPEKIEINGLEDVLPLMNKCINEIRQGTLPPKSANAIGYLTNIAIEVLNKTELIDRLERIENVLEIRKKAPKVYQGINKR